MSESESQRGSWWLWPSVLAVVMLDVLVRRADLTLWPHMLILVGAVLLLNRLGIRGWLWRTLTVAVLLSTIVVDLTNWGHWLIRAASIPVAWLLCVAAATAMEVIREVILKPAAKGWRQGLVEHAEQDSDDE